MARVRPAGVAKPRAAKPALQAKQVQSSVTSLLTRADDETVVCPICFMDLAALEFGARSRHVTDCLEGPPSTASQSLKQDSEGSISGESDMSDLPLEDSIPRDWTGAGMDEVSVDDVEIKTEGLDTGIVESKRNFDSEAEIVVEKTEEAVYVAEETQVKSEGIITIGSTTCAIDFVQKAIKIDSSFVPSNGKEPAKKYSMTMPFYKVLTFGPTQLSVDAFCYGPIPKVTNYYLTHFHSDHYGGLSKSWKHGLIYCSEPTARLVQMNLKVAPEYLRPLPMNTPVMVDGIEVLLLDANHCPGSAIMLFSGHGSTMLHTGDFRASKTHVSQVKQYLFERGKADILDAVYLDTTYLNPSHCFPSQDCVVRACGQYCVEMRDSGEIPSRMRTIHSYFSRTKPVATYNPVVLVGSYTIGKERLAIHIAELLGSKIFCKPAKQRTLRALGDGRLNAMLCDDGTQCNVHIVGMNELNMDSLRVHWDHLKKHFSHLLAFAPTGWTHRPGKGQAAGSEGPSTPAPFAMEELMACRKTNNNIHLFRVPYSEHSSFPELEYFCRNVPSLRVIPTVNTANPRSRERMQHWLQKWSS